MADLELVERALAQPGHEQFPEAAGDVLPHGVAAAVPVVEVADHADAGGVGRPDGEVHALDAVDGAELRPQPVVALPVPAFVQQVQIVVGQQVRKGVGIVHGHFLSPFVGHAEHVARLPVPLGDRTNGLEQAGRMDPPHGPGRVGVAPDRPPRPGQTAGKNARTASARRPESSTRCGPNELEGVFVPSLNQLPNTLQHTVVRTRTSLQVIPMVEPRTPRN